MRDSRYTEVVKEPVLNTVVLRILSWAVFVLIWHLFSMILSDGLLIASPVKTIRRLSELSATGAFWLRTGASALRICLGILISIIAAISYGMLSLRYRSAEIMIEPLINVMKSTPVAVFIILMLVILTGNAVPSAISFIISFPMIYTNFLTGLRSSDRKLLEMADVFEMKSSDVWRTIRLSSAEPYLKSSLKVAIGMGWKAGIAAEIIGATGKSIGEALYSAKIFLMTEDIFSYGIVIIIMSILTEELLSVAVLKLYSSIRRSGL